MYQVLVYVYETYGDGDACPGRELLGRRLSSAGFEREDIVQALGWLEGLRSAVGGAPADETTHKHAPAMALPAGAQSMRIYTDIETVHLGSDGIACLEHLHAAGALPSPLREVVIDRALDVPESPLALDDLKIIVLMVFWQTGVNPGLLVLDELCDDVAHRVAH